MSTEDGGVRHENIEQSEMQRAGDGLLGNTLQGCLIGADPEQAKREGRVRRRAFVVSTLLQAAVLLAVLAIPFFAKVERIALANVEPIPPYRPYRGARAQLIPAGPQVATRTTFCLACRLAHPQPRESDGSGRSSSNTDSPEGTDEPGVTSGELCVTGCINIGRPLGPGPPPPPATAPPVVHLTHIDQALLLERVAPIYPALAKQIHREGRVELHAIISTDGTIESLEVVSGDALFYQSALDAVRRWRYRPLRLNGQAVRVDTYITVIYTLQG
jgi:TonB family protein